MSGEHHVSRAGGGEVTDSQGRHSQSEISLNDIRAAQATCSETVTLRRVLEFGIDHLSRWVELKRALPHVREEEAFALLRDVWIPHHEVPRVVLSDNGPQFIAEVVKLLCRSQDMQLAVSSPRELDLSTPHTTTNHSPYSLVQAEKLSYPYSDAGMLRRWAAPSKRWLERLCAARVQANQEHMQADNERKRLLSEPGAILPGGTVVAIKLAPAESQAIYRKLAPRCSGPWTVTRVLDNGTTYCVQDPVTHHGKHVSRERVKVFGLHGASADPAGGTFPRWIGPDERRPNNLPSTRVDDQSHTMSPEDTLTVTEPQEHEQSC
ncbi:hypothetical protein Efla_007643 [Eimeria flavescens]